MNDDETNAAGAPKLHTVDVDGYALPARYYGDDYRVPYHFVATDSGVFDVAGAMADHSPNSGGWHTVGAWDEPTPSAWGDIISHELIELTDPDARARLAAVFGCYDPERDERHRETLNALNRPHREGMTAVAYVGMVLDRRARLARVSVRRHRPARRRKRGRGRK